MRLSLDYPLRLSLTCIWLSLLAAGTGVVVDNASAARGHVFGKVFGWGVSDGTEKLETCTETCQPGIPGPGKGQFTKPSGIAVSEASGDIYVVDEGNDRVEWFDAGGTYLGQFDGSGNFEVEGKTETEGGGPPTGAFARPTVIAVDNTCVRLTVVGAACSAADPSNGDVYVVDTGHSVIDKFTATGKYVGQILVPHEEGTPLELKGVAVDPHGQLLVSEGHGLGNVGFDDYSNAEANSHEQFLNDRGVGFRTGLAVDSKASLYATVAFEAPFEDVIAKFSRAGEEVGIVDKRTSTGVAVEWPRDDVYVNSLGTVGRFDAAGAEVERFGEGHLPNLTEVEAFEGRPFNYRSGIAVNSVRTSGTVYVADAVGSEIVAFPLEPPGPPTVEGASVSDVTSGSATLRAVVNPRGAVTEYRFEYGLCSSSALSSCASTPFELSLPAPGDGLTGAPLDFENHEVSVHPQNLKADSLYHFRVLARNESSAPESFFESTEEVFRTRPGVPTEPLDSRAWEMVSPARKHGTLIHAIGAEDLIQAAAGGGAFTYVTSSPTENAPQGYSNFVQVMARRTKDGWTSEDLDLAHQQATGQGVGQGQEYRLFSDDLTLGIVQPFGAFEPSITPDATEQTPYLRMNFLGGNAEYPCASNCYQPMVTAVNVAKGVPFGEEGKCPPHVICGPVVEGASQDGRHVVLESKVGLTSATGDKGGLYEWDNGALSLISVLPGPENKPASLASTPTLGEADLTRNAVSTDGSRVVWSEGKANGHLYLRDMSTDETTELDEGLSGSALFQAASSDDSMVFFTVGGELYVYNVKQGKRLRLTLPVGSGEVSEVQGVIAGASTDGSYVYFVADGRLSEEANQGHGTCEGTGSSEATHCYLYEIHDIGGTWGVPRLVAVLSGEDHPDFANGLAGLTARVSPSGRWLAFMSRQSLTGYDNQDGRSGVPDEEVFLFDSSTDRLVCASCNPTGARPTGVEFRQIAHGLVGGSRGWSLSAWLAGSIPGWTPYKVDASFYQSRYLSDEGRLFFNTSDSLVGIDGNHTEDVYEFEPVGVGSCSSSNVSFSEQSDGCVDLISTGTSQSESAFLDASASGSDAFFLTVAKLVTSDSDSALDVYDARECSIASPCLQSPPPPQPPCVTEASCKRAPTPQPEAFGAAEDLFFSGFGNIILQPSSLKRQTHTQLLAKAVKRCRRQHPHSKKRRVACERRAKARHVSRADMALVKKPVG